MLAIFDKNVAKSPEALQNQEGGSVCALKDEFLLNHFSSIYPSAVKINFGSSGLIACSLDKQNPLLPRFLQFFVFFWDYFHDDVLFRRKKRGEYVFLNNPILNIHEFDLIELFSYV